MRLTNFSAAWITLLVAILTGFVITGSWVFIIAFACLATINVVAVQALGYFKNSE
jgi:hypothetical protein